MAGTPPHSPPSTPSSSPKASASAPATSSAEASPRLVQDGPDSARVTTLMTALRAEKALAAKPSIAAVLSDSPSSPAITDAMLQARVKAESSAWKSAAATPLDEEVARANAALARNHVALQEARAALAAPSPVVSPLTRQDTAELALQQQWESAFQARESALDNALERTQTLMEALNELPVPDSRPGSSGSDGSKAEGKQWEEVSPPKILVTRKWQENGGKETRGAIGKAGEMIKGFLGKR